MPNKVILESINIIIALYFLHNIFETITISRFEQNNKKIDEIQQILALAEVKFTSKQAIGMTKSLTIMF